MTNNIIIDIYTDGSCIKNPGKGAYAFFEPKSEYKFVAGEYNTTNNRMELKAVISAIEYAMQYKNIDQINIYTDSSYVVNGYNSWIISWTRNNWKNSQKQEVLNRDLWEIVYNLKLKNKNVKLIWIKGHNGNKYNEIVDELAQSKARNL